ncbi:hypothetical protein DMUE_0047 [Dictyocoela muelleri]|nr:hypothetical protein DMUE_0047 [Dictyocoela muelleri]
MINDKKINVNHLLYMDDAKLFAYDEKVINLFYSQFKNSLNSIGFYLNEEKSQGNIKLETLPITKSENNIKYLGIHENCLGKNEKITCQSVKDKIFQRIESLCSTELNAKNLFEAINQFAIPVMNYHIGILNIPEREYENINLEIRKILTKHKIYNPLASPERLYLKRNDLGRGLTNVTHLSERILLNMNKYISNNYTERQQIIPNYLSYHPNSVLKINEPLRSKYGQNINNIKDLYNLERQHLLEALFKKSLHVTYI